MSVASCCQNRAFQHSKKAAFGKPMAKVEGGIRIKFR